MWHKISKAELIQAIEQLERIAKDNRDIAERSLAQAKGWKELYEQSSTDPEAVQVSKFTH